MTTGGSRWIERCTGTGTSWTRTGRDGEELWLYRSAQGWQWGVFAGYGGMDYRRIAHSGMTREEWDAFRAIPANWPDARAVVRGVRAIILSGFMPCGICGEREYVDGDEHQCVTVDHICERADGGDNWPGNLQPAHRICNVRKGNAAKRRRRNAA